MITILSRREHLEREEMLRYLLLSTHAYAEIIDLLDHNNELVVYEMQDVLVFYPDPDVLLEAGDHRGGDFKLGASYFYFDSSDNPVSLESYYVEEFREAAAADLLSGLNLQELVYFFISLSRFVDTDEIESKLIEWSKI